MDKKENDFSASMLKKQKNFIRVFELLEQGLEKDAIFQTLQSEGLVGTEITDAYYNAYNEYLNKHHNTHTEKTQSDSKSNSKFSTSIVFIALVAISIWWWFGKPSNSSSSDSNQQQNNSNNYLSQEKTNEIPPEIIRKVPPEIEKTYNFINGKSFEGTIYREQYYLSLIKVYQKLTFNPINEYEGNVLVEKRYEEASAATDGSIKRERITTSYYIDEDGKIIIGPLILEKESGRYGYKGLKSNLNDNEGYSVTFYPTY